MSAKASVTTTPTISRRGVLVGIGNKFRKHHPYHGAGGDPEAHWQEWRKGVHGQVGGHGHDRLRQAGEYGPQRSQPHRHSAGHQYKTDCEAFGNVVYGYGGSDEGGKLSEPPKETPTPTPSANE